MTWLTAASAAVSLGCVLCSAQRLVWALCPTRFDARVLSKALRSSTADDAARLRSTMAGSGRADWEVDVLGTLTEASLEARAAGLSEELTEFEGLAQRWSRVPRVCASVATSAGFLFASIALIQDLSSLDPGSPGGAEFEGVLFSALDALAVGVAGTSFCASVHVRARRAARDRLDAAQRLVDSLQAIDGGAAPGSASNGGSEGPAL